MALALLNHTDFVAAIRKEGYLIVADAFDSDEALSGVTLAKHAEQGHEGLEKIVSAMLRDVIGLGLLQRATIATYLINNLVHLPPLDLSPAVNVSKKNLTATCMWFKSKADDGKAIKEAFASPDEKEKIAAIRSCIHFIDDDSIIGKKTGLSRGTIGRAAARDHSGTMGASGKVLKFPSKPFFAEPAVGNKIIELALAKDCSAIEALKVAGKPPKITAGAHSAVVAALDDLYKTWDLGTGMKWDDGQGGGLKSVWATFISTPAGTKFACAEEKWVMSQLQQRTPASKERKQKRKEILAAASVKKKAARKE